MLRWPIQLPRRVALASVALTALVGCAHYKLGSQPSGEGESGAAAVGVATVGVPADWGVDGPRLTRSLVEELRIRGLRDVAWSGEETRTVAVECSVDAPEPETFGSLRGARVAAECLVETGEHSSKIRATGRETTANPVGGDDIESSRRTALEYAAVDALSRAAPRLARVIRERATPTTGEDDG